MKRNVWLLGSDLVTESLQKNKKKNNLHWAPAVCCVLSEQESRAHLQCVEWLLPHTLSPARQLWRQQQPAIGFAGIQQR